MRIGLEGNCRRVQALFMVWQKAGLEEAIGAKSVSGGNPIAPGNGHGHGHRPHFFSTMSQEFQKK